MVKDPRTPTGAGSLLPLNLPQPVAVEAAADGTPRGLLVRGRMRPVIAISDRWRIDDEWWRAEISRQYFAVEVAGGTRVTIFQDLVTGAWFSQRYTAPVRLEAG